MISVFLHSHARDRLAAVKNRAPLCSFLDALARNPETVGDYREADPRGRPMEVKILGRYAIIFFKDPYAGIVKILEIRNVESI